MLLLPAVVAGLASNASSWKVKVSEFSMLAIGVGVRDEHTAWSTQSLGTNPTIIKSTDFGATWNPVTGNATTGMTLGVAATKSPDALEVVTVGMVANRWSVDGENFGSSKTGKPFLDSQSIKLKGKRAIQTWDDGVCLSEDGGATYRCVEVPLKNKGTARYAAWPSADVVRAAAGTLCLGLGAW
jgi:hypothetical protein